MSTSTTSPSPLTTYRALSFDVFGTLLDWESALYPLLQPLISQLPASHPCAAPFHPAPSPTNGRPSSPPSSSTTPLPPTHPIFHLWDTHELKLEAELPKLPHGTLLAYAYRDLATELGVEARGEDAEAVGREVYGRLRAFGDTVGALKRLRGRGVKLVGLSNVWGEGWRQVRDGPFKDITFDAIYTAEDIGSYKPALDNFEYLVDAVKRDFGIEKEQLLHVAHGISSDQVTPEAMGIDHVWVERGTDNGRDMLEGMKRLRTVRDMRELADQFDAAYQ